MRRTDSADGGGDHSAKCFCSGILRRLLICTGATLPTHPSDQFLLDSTPGLQKPAYQESTKQAAGGGLANTGPGVVARLMGLDTIPNHTTTTLGSLLRTRSVNSIDFLYHFDPNKQGHRRVRTSVSFREGGLHNCDYTTPASLLQHLLNSKGEKPTTKEPQQLLIIQDKKRLDQMEGGRRFQRRTRPKAKSDLVVMASKKRNTALAHKMQPPAAKTNLNKVHLAQPSSPVRSRKPLLPEAANGEDRAIVTKDKNEGMRMKAKERICSNPRVRRTWRMEAGKNVNEDRMDDGVVFFRFEFLEDICQQFAQEILHVSLRQLVDELVIASWDNELPLAAPHKHA